MKKLKGKAPPLWPLLIALATTIMMACTPSPVNPVTDADASTVDASPFGSYDCATWCTHARDLRCAAALDTEHGGASCIDVCKNTLDSPMPFNVQCRSLASTCSAADACENGGVQAKPMAPDGDASITVTVSATCANWCSHALDLKCPAAQKTPKGSSCVNVCNNVMTGPMKFNLRCRVTARSCAIADTCEK